MSTDTVELLHDHIKALTDELKILRMQPSRKLDEITLAFKSIENDVHKIWKNAKHDIQQMALVQQSLNNVHRALLKLTDSVKIRTPQTLAAFDKMFLTETHPTFGGRKNINYPNSSSGLDSDEVYSSSSDDDDDDDEDDDILKDDDSDEHDTDATSEDEKEDNSDITSKDEEDAEQLVSDDETDSDTSNSFLASDSDLDESQIF